MNWWRKIGKKWRDVQITLWRSVAAALYLFHYPYPPESFPNAYLQQLCLQLKPITFFPLLKPVPMPYPHPPAFSHAEGELASSAGEHRHPHDFVMPARHTTQQKPCTPTAALHFHIYKCFVSKLHEEFTAATSNGADTVLATSQQLTAFNSAVTVQICVLNPMSY